jgi:hypothetical protein
MLTDIPDNRYQRTTELLARMANSLHGKDVPGNFWFCSSHAYCGQTAALLHSFSEIPPNDHAPADEYEIRRLERKRVLDALLDIMRE